MKPSSCLRAALWLVLSPACSSLPPPMIGDPGPELPDAAANAEYKALLNHFSAQRQVFNGFDTILFGGVTYESPTFVAARIRRRDTFQAQPPAQVAEDVTAAEAEANKFYEFMLAAYIQNPRFDDLDLPNSIWRVMLVTPVAEVPAASVKRVGKADVNFRAYYPYMGDFWTVYRVRFPKAIDNRPLVPPEVRAFTLVLASSLGKAEFVLPTQ